MAKWRVWNEHPLNFTHKEKFKGNDLVIPGGKYILMDHEEAVQFRGQYFPMIKDAMGNPDPKGFKCIRLEPDEESKMETKAPEFICMRDGARFPTQAMLDRHIEANYKDDIVKDEALEEELVKEKRKPGRPKSA